MKSLKVGDKFILVDDSDFSLVAPHRWYITTKRQYGKHDRSYAWARIDGKVVHMHRFLLRPEKGELVDHINHDGLDNRRANIRLCNETQNHLNMRRKVRSSSGLKGVYFKGVNRTHPWAAEAELYGVRHRLGAFQTKELASEAYQCFARNNFGEFYQESN